MAAMNKIQDKLFLGNIKSASDIEMLKKSVSGKLHSIHSYKFVLVIF